MNNSKMRSYYRADPKNDTYRVHHGLGIAGNPTMHRMFLACLVSFACLWFPTRALAIGPVKALEFDGVNDYVSAASSPLLKSTTAMTIELWAYRETWSAPAATNTFISCTQTGGYNLTLSTAGYLRAAVRVNGVYRTPQVDVSGLAPGWHHLVFSFNTSGQWLYVDGVLRASDNGAGVITYDIDNSIQIGAEASGGTTPEGPYFEGKMDEIRVWTVVRTAQQIRENMHLTLAGTEADLGAYLRCDLGSGTGLLDSSGNNNHAFSGADITMPAWIDSTIPLAAGTSH
ncbi:MAG: LamG domain-containing protein, partial [Lentisphaeria bacterium]|nr:LamG domain-containing protein [Lentisphaeria bacterium]